MENNNTKKQPHKTKRNSLEFTSNGDGTCYVSGIGSYPYTDIMIPPMYGGERVTGIGDMVFLERNDLTSVIIPDTVKVIGKLAFYNCTGLKDIQFLGTKAQWEAIEKGNDWNLHVPVSVTCNFNEAQPIVGSKNIPVIRKASSYADEKPLKKKKPVKQKKLIEKKKPIKEKKIFGKKKFSKPLHILLIAFLSVAIVFIIYSMIPSIGLNFTKNTDGTYSVSGIGTCIDKNIKIPSTYKGQPVTSIGVYAFQYCYKLTSITIPDSVTSICYRAFSGCSKLTSITIPDSVTSIGDSAFENCSGLTSITIPDSVTSIDSYAFSGCYGLTRITIPDSVTSIGDGAFRNCSGLTSITLPFVGNTLNGTSNTHFGYIFGASSYSNNGYLVPRYLNTVVITGGSSIGSSAFYDCSNLTSITIPDSVTSIGEWAFYNCSGLTSVTIGNSVTSIGEWAFSRCSKLTSITIPDSVTSIGNSAFYNCTGLTNITIPDSVTSIGGEAFRSCVNLTSVTIGNSVTSIGDYAFYNCSGLTSITIPDSVTSIGGVAFYNCTGLTSITFNGTKAQWNAISKDSYWKVSVPATEVICSDGTVSLS